MKYPKHVMAIKPGYRWESWQSCNRRLEASSGTGSAVGCFAVRPKPRPLSRRYYPYRPVDAA